jgi:hypothetical protein
MIEEPIDRARQSFSEITELKKRKEFSTREVGINHPDNKGFIRISDSGEIEIFAAPGIGIVISPSTRAISFFADSIKFYTKEDDGLRWNNSSFNPASDVYNEPSLIKTSDFHKNPAFYKIGYYLNNLDQLDEIESVSPITIGGDYGLGLIPGQEGDFITPAVEPQLSESDQSLLENYMKTHSDTEIRMLKYLLINGYSFSEASKKVENNDYQVGNNMEDFPWIENDLE